MAGTPARIAIFGGKGGGCHAAQTVLNRARSGRPHAFAGYLNDRLPVGSALLGGTVLCNFDAWPNLDSDVLFLAPLHKVGFMQQNCTRIIKLGISTSRWTTSIDPMAAVADDAEIGLGTYLVSFASISASSKVGSHCALRQGAVVGNDVTVGDFVFVGANVMLCSGSNIASGAHIAPGAQVGNDVTVGRFAVVGLGATVTKDVPDYAVVAGNPARLLREIEPIDVPTWSFQP
jgi:acetyltransferase-like isoleucine patch superfamily enzyme